MQVLSDLRRQQVRRPNGASAGVDGQRVSQLSQPPARYVFPTASGGPLDAANVRRAFRTAIQRAEGVTASQWTPRELRHSFVSLLSDQGVPVEEIARLVGHSSTTTMELVYRKQIGPVIQPGAVVMDTIFGSGNSK